MGNKIIYLEKERMKKNMSKEQEKNKDQLTLGEAWEQTQGLKMDAERLEYLVRIREARAKLAKMDADEKKGE